MGTHFERSARMPIWIAGISICLLAASGMVAIVRSIPASYASIATEISVSPQGSAPNSALDVLANNLPARLAAARAAANRRHRRCAECGVVESARRIERAGELRNDTDLTGGALGSEPSANALPEAGYEFTVRFRNGSTRVFNEATPRAWRLGDWVIVIGPSSAAID